MGAGVVSRGGNGVKIRVGDRFDMPDEHVHGVVTNVVEADGEVASIVVKCDEGDWAAVDCSRIKPCAMTLH